MTLIPKSPIVADIHTFFVVRVREQSCIRARSLSNTLQGVFISILIARASSLTGSGQRIGIGECSRVTLRNTLPGKLVSKETISFGALQHAFLIDQIHEGAIRAGLVTGVVGVIREVARRACSSTTTCHRVGEVVLGAVVDTLTSSGCASCMPSWLLL